MTSPFPGMDPYLEDEKLWPLFQHQLVLCLYQILLPGLPQRYEVRIARRQYVADRTPLTSAVPGEHQEEFIEIRDRGDGKLVTLLDVVSPATKTTAAGRHALLEQRRRARESGANVVEVDLVLGGRPTLGYSRLGLPDWDYAVTVTRAAPSERHEIYCTTLQKRLPRFRLPLAPDDRDTGLDLGAIVKRCYVEGGFSGRISYRREPAVPLDEKDRRWLEDMLVENGLREPSHEQVARAAYAVWEQDGRPHGKDREHWHRAWAQLRQGNVTGP
jgi:hypothetical protein